MRAAVKTMKKFSWVVLTLGVLALSRSPAMAANGYRSEKACREDSISAVDGDGAILTMLSATIWKVDEADRVDSELWLGASDALICGQQFEFNGTPVTLYTVINKEEEGEEVTVTLIGHK